MKCYYHKYFRKKIGSSVVGWNKKISTALPKLVVDQEEEGNYDTGIDLTEADFIPDDIDDHDSSGFVYEFIFNIFVEIVFQILLLIVPTPI